MAGANINTWLGDDPNRRFLVRGLHDPDGGTGIARALLSDSYRVVDNLDVLMAVLSGVRDAGVPVDVAGCDLTERRMYLLTGLRDDTPVSWAWCGWGAG